MSELNITSDKLSFIFSGTPEYISPEQLEEKGVGLESDWWTLGTLIYEMLVGRPPFTGKNPEELFKSILKGKVEYNIHFLTPVAVDLIKKLLLNDPRKRLGANGANEIMKHPFFDDIDFNNLMLKKIKPPFMPRLKSNTDTKYIDENFLEINPIDSYNQSDVVQSVDDPFKNSSQKMTYEMSKGEKNQMKIDD